MIKKEYIQPTVKAVKINLPVVLNVISGEGNTPPVDTDDPGFENEDDI
jgi:hypothetical protein